ncbi:hypothetical protein D3C87_1233500 [compost metagenome]
MILLLEIQICSIDSIEDPDIEPYLRHTTKIKNKLKPFMKTTIYSLFFFLISHTNIFSQTIDQLKIENSEMPKEYIMTETPNCISIQACLFYKKTEMYSAFLGKAKNKSVQNFESKNDNGSIMYFEFEKDFTGEAFVKGLLWGKENKPTAEHPEQIFTKGKFLVIWSFHDNSALQKISETKVKKALN